MRADWEAGAAGRAGAGAVPHVVAWNLTRRCNLACPHCYISAGSWQATDSDLTTDECLRITDEVLTVNPAPLMVLSGGEPLLRDDLETIAAHASGRGATVVVGTNGTLLDRARIASLRRAGVTGVAVSVDSLDPRYHDRFRHGAGALAETLAAVRRLREAGLDFVVQTTLTRGNRAEIPRIAEWAAEAGAVAFNLYFLVETGRGAAMRGLSPDENDAVLAELLELEQRYRGRMLVRSKCQPQIMRHAHRAGSDSSLVRYSTRCPCGIHYCRITPDGKLTPCPYLPVEAGDLRSASFGEVWRESGLLRTLRAGEPGGRCGRCEYREVCGGCRARAWTVDGDYMGEDPACAWEPVPGAALVRPPAEPYGSPATEPSLPWSAEAEGRMRGIPSFVRGVVQQRVERWARERGHREVTAEVLTAVRAEMPVDFSRRLPFFARRDT